MRPRRRRSARTPRWREYELGLPAELDAGQCRDLVRAFAEDIRDRYGVVDAQGLGAKTRQLDVRSSASVEVEVEAIRERWAEQVNCALELAQVAERVDHRSYARQGVETEPTVKMGHASAAIERRAYAEQIAVGEEPHAVTPRGQMNEAVEEKRGLGVYLERGREWLQEIGQRVRDQAELAAHGIASLVQGAARTMRARLQTSTGDGF